MEAVDGDALAARLEALIRPGDHIWWSQATAEPLTLTRALVEHRHRIARGARLRVFVGIGHSDTLQPSHADVFDFFGYAGGGAHRELARAGVLDIVPCHYSQLQPLIGSGVLPVDVACIQVSRPDATGRYSLGLVHEYMPAVVDRARVVIAEVHPDIPWTHGSRHLVADDFDLLVSASHPLQDATSGVPGPVEQAIGAHVAGWVEDGATLQLGVGNIPEAVLAALMHHRDLGLHSGAVGDGVAALAESGVLTNARKTVDTHVGVAGILIGSERLRRWAHRNDHLVLRETRYTHDIGVLSRMDRFVAINSAIEVDVTGQVNAEVAAGVYMGAIGGAVDFLRGAARSRGGHPVVALPATAKGASRIVARLSGPVSTSRADAGLIVTEHGVADLRGRTLSQRVRALVDIAAPEHRAELERAAHGQLRQQGAAFVSRNRRSGYACG